MARACSARPTNLRLEPQVGNQSQARSGYQEVKPGEQEAQGTQARTEQNLVVQVASFSCCWLKSSQEANQLFQDSTNRTAEVASKIRLGFMSLR